MSNIVIIRHASSHHSGFSGYAQLIKHLNFPVISGFKSWLPYRIKKFVSERVDKSTGLYDTVSLQKEIELIWKMVTKSRGLAHFLNGERDIHYSTYVKGFRDWQQIATFHKPPAVLKSVIRSNKFIGSLDGAIAVGVNQVDYLTKVVGINQVRFIPHGVDINFFFPDDSRRDGHAAIFVGYHLRDFEILQSIVDRVSAHIPDFKLHIVGDQNVFRNVVNQSNIIIHSSVSNETLRELYQRSSLLLLPLRDVTACNTILEALACGLPIVTNRLDGHYGYLNSRNSLQLQRNATEMANAVIEVLENENLNKEMSFASRSASVNFSWPIISTQTAEFYKLFN